MAAKPSTARLLCAAGYTIRETECDTKKEAIARAKYFLSDDFAQIVESTHEKLGTMKAEVLVGGECEWDMFHPQYKEPVYCSYCGGIDGKHDDDCDEAA